MPLTPLDRTALTSRTFDAVKFIAAIMVVCSHYLRQEIMPDFNRAAAPLTDFIGQFFFAFTAYAMVPMFFVISGYLLCRTETFDRNVYTRQMKSRLKRLGTVAVVFVYVPLLLEIAAALLRGYSPELSLSSFTAPLFSFGELFPQNTPYGIFATCLYSAPYHPCSTGCSGASLACGFQPAARCMCSHFTDMVQHTASAAYSFSRLATGCGCTVTTLSNCRENFSPFCFHSTSYWAHILSPVAIYMGSHGQRISSHACLCQCCLPLCPMPSNVSISESQPQCSKPPSSSTCCIIPSGPTLPTSTHSICLT